MPTTSLKPFQSLTVGELYALLSLRSEVFVVEQQSIYCDLDGYDQAALHMLTQDGQGLAAYLRVLPPESKHAEPSFGRLVVAPRARGAGMATQMIQDALCEIASRWPHHPIRIDAQLYLKDYYARFGFAPDGADYVLDGIPHIQMIRTQP